MIEHYRSLFCRYLKILKEDYDENNPYDGLDDLCNKCQRFKYELIGMLELMKEAGEIDDAIEEKEFNNIIKSFSTNTLFNAYMEPGEVMIWCKN